MANTVPRPAHSGKVHPQDGQSLETDSEEASIAPWWPREIFLGTVLIKTKESREADSSMESGRAQKRG